MFCGNFVEESVPFGHIRVAVCVRSKLFLWPIVTVPCALYLLAILFSLTENVCMVILLSKVFPLDLGVKCASVNSSRLSRMIVIEDSNLLECDSVSLVDCLTLKLKTLLILRNVGNYSRNDTVSLAVRLESSATLAVRITNLCMIGIIVLHQKPIISCVCVYCHRNV
jgi:hypothetical protein